MGQPDDAFDRWWTEHYSLANLAYGAAADAWEAATQAERKSNSRKLTDYQYMIAALVSMLGPTGVKVWKGWQRNGVQRVHHEWGPDAAALTGEQRAEVILGIDAAIREPSVSEPK